MKQTASILNPFQPASLITITAEQHHSCISLHKLVSKIKMGLSFKAIHKTELVVNNVAIELLVSTDKAALGTLLNSLLSNMLLHGQNDAIILSAKVIGNITVVHIKTSDTGQMDAISKTIDKIQPMARSIGGCITISNSKFHGIDLAFTFVNH